MGDFAGKIAEVTGVEHKHNKLVTEKKKWLQDGLTMVVITTGSHSKVIIDDQNKCKKQRHNCYFFN